MRKIQVSVFCLFLGLNVAYGQEIVGKANNITEGEIRSEFKKYPNNVVQKYLKRIDISLIDGKTQVSAGYAHPFTQSITINPTLSKKEFIETFHHEFSSLLLIGYDFVNGHKLNASFDKYHRLFWNLNGSFKYDNTIDSHGKLSIEEQNYFVFSTYARSGFENDWNMICEMMFTTGLKESDTPIGQKIKLIKEFLLQIDPQFEFINP